MERSIMECHPSRICPKRSDGRLLLGFRDLDQNETQSELRNAIVAGILSAMFPAAHAQHEASDPSVRSGPPGAGGPIDGLSAAQKSLFDFVTGEFAQVHSVTGNIPGEESNRLGPAAQLT
jgi:hypothetical protein